MASTMTMSEERNDILGVKRLICPMVQAARMDTSVVRYLIEQKGAFDDVAYVLCCVWIHWV